MLLFAFTMLCEKRGERMSKRKGSKKSDRRSQIQPRFLCEIKKKRRVGADEFVVSKGRRRDREQKYDSSPSLAVSYSTLLE